MASIFLNSNHKISIERFHSDYIRKMERWVREKEYWINIDWYNGRCHQRNIISGSYECLSNPKTYWCPPPSIV
jgi:hypothetical protein